MPNTTNFNFPTPADTDLVKDGASAIRSLGNSIDTAFVDLKGGTTGQILSKASNTDLDYTWIANDQGDITEVSAGTGISVASGTGPVPVVTNTVATTFDAKGDLVVGTGPDTFAKLPVGTNGHTLVADSAQATGVKWAAPGGGGKVLQVVGATTTTSTVIASTTYTDTTITATITPTSASSKIMVFVNGYAYLYRGSNEMAIGLKLVRGATDIYTNTFAFYPAIVGATSIEFNSFYPVMYLDSPATTSATTYKIQGKVSATSSGGSSTWQSGSVASTITLMEIGA